VVDNKKVFSFAPEIGFYTNCTLIGMLPVPNRISNKLLNSTNPLSFMHEKADYFCFSSYKYNSYNEKTKEICDYFLKLKPIITYNNKIKGIAGNYD